MKATIIVLLILLSDPFRQIGTDQTISKEFYYWNEKTLESIIKHKNLANERKDKKWWQNRLKSSKIVLYAPLKKNPDGSIKEEPLRYKLLSLLHDSGFTNDHFFVIETQDEGEVVVLKRFLIKPEKNNSRVVLYYYNNKWVKVKDTILSNIDLTNQMINQNLHEQNSESNGDDLIISEFTKGKINCNYYLPYTVIPNSSIQKILTID